jgi:hypothetical protein
MRYKKYYTTKEWNNFRKNNYFDMQELLCQKYDVILTDYKTKKEKILSILSHINFENLDKAITQFDKLFASFGESAEQLTRESNYSKQNKQNLDSIWGKSTNSVPIWSDSESSQTNHEANLEKIWGKRNV